MNKSGDILLDSGTNELEVILFYLGNETYGINVLKVREIIVPMPITKLPQSHDHVEGVIRLREEVLPVINLEKVLNIPREKIESEDKFIVCELNQTKIAFRVHGVKKIHRISWEQIEKPDDLSTGRQPFASGIIKMADEMAILLDFEKVVIDISPKVGINVEAVKALGPRERNTKKIIVAEDSAVLRELIKDTLYEAGYQDVQFYQNGKEAWDYLESIGDDKGKNPLDTVQLLITDIEMPQMDGHHLTKRVKSHPRLKDIPVLIFSSLITEDLQHKGEQVGASGQISKPDIVRLIQEIDKLVL
ncbi:chemotaxis protein [Virgibacillus soli]|uniref:Chemotaxis protein n=1 Tax=Paracerasibacillus soli TaxID=480284 RepID=A0ABU5CUW6_9BACI|nr:chemotaxis protein [Virgibacillus soli]MDY0410162.1 chemotaxis protein [Virgibacillus soli]